nr:hypothetical protein [Tanacetum cinerariifolium]
MNRFHVVLPIFNPYMEPIIPPIPIPGHLREHEYEAHYFRTLEGLKKVKISRPLICVVKKMPEYLKYVKDVFSSKEPITEEDAINESSIKDDHRIVSSKKSIKEIWDRVKLLIQGSELSLQERESKFYDNFHTFTSMPGETIHSQYMRFAEMINDMHTIGMTMKPLQVKTKFVNHLLLEWSKFITDVKLAKDMHATNFDNLYAHLRQHEAYENEVRLQRQRPSHNQDAPKFKEFFIINELQAQLKAKNVSIEKLKEHITNIKEKNVVDIVQNVYNSNVVTSKVYKLDLPPLSPCIKNNMAAHVDYLKNTQENDDILREIIEHARDLRPLDSDLASACKLVTCIQKLLVYVSATCPSSKHVSDKLVAATPMNMTRKVSDYLNDVHASVKSKSVKSRSAKSKKKKMWKPTSKVYINVWVRRIRTDNETEFVNQTLCEYYEEVGISHETSAARSPQQNGVIESQAVATACYTQNRSIIRLRHGKTPYELLHNKLPDLSFLHVFGALFYPTNDSEFLGKLQPKANIGILICYAPTKKAFRIYNRRTRRIVETIHVDFHELTLMASEQSSSGPALNEMTPATITDSTGSPYSTTVDQDAPSPSKSHTTAETQSSVIPQDVEEDNLDIEVAHMGNDPLFGVSIPKVTSAQSSSTASPHSIVQPAHPTPQHPSKCTKDHPLQNIIGQLSRPVSTRLQLHEQAFFCYYDAFLTSVEPKTYKEALTQSCWIEAMQEELNKFE